MTTEIILPEMGEGVIEGTLSRWLVQEGDNVDQFAAIAEIETDKVTTELMAEKAGTILKLMVKEGQTIPVNTVLAYVSEEGEDVSAGKIQSEAEFTTNGNTTSSTDRIAKSGVQEISLPSGGYTGRISPVVGRIATEHNVDLALVKGTGRDGRVTKDDILNYIEGSESSGPDQDILPVETAVIADQEQEGLPDPGLAKADSGSPTVSLTTDDILPMTAMRRSIANHMVFSKRTSPHVTTVFEIDFSTVAAHRALHMESFAKDGAKFTFTVYIIAAAVQALKLHPLANSAWSEEGIILKREINIGMAAAVPDGLTVPVIKGADGMNLLGLARIINDLTHRARNKKLKHDDLQGGTFSITNHGTSGSLFATPIINQPQAGILGVGKIEKRVKVIDDAIAIRPLAYASFTFDHRILDGATADAFVSTIKEIIENWS